MLQGLGSLLRCSVILLGTAAPLPVLASGPSPCGLLSKAEVAKATGLAVGAGMAGPAIPGVLGKCTWTTVGRSRVIVTLADARHMQLTISAQEHAGGTAIAGLGRAAVGIEGAPFTGGGYIVNVLDAQGGFGLSVLGREGNRDRAVALARVVESHR